MQNKFEYSISTLFSTALNSKNKFQPTSEQIKILQKDNILEELRKEPLEWIQIMNSFINYFYNGLKTKKKLDHQQRVEELIRKVINLWNSTHKKITLVLMDGHGRITIPLLFRIYEVGLLKQVEIHVVDNDEIVDNFHKLFFPEMVKCSHKDIYEYIQELPNKENAIIYLNFCSIGGKKGINCFKSFFVKCAFPVVMLSFKITRGFSENYPGVKKIKGNYYVDNYNPSKDFVRHFMADEASKVSTYYQWSFPTYIFEDVHRMKLQETMNLRSMTINNSDVKKIFNSKMQIPELRELLKKNLKAPLSEEDTIALLKRMMDFYTKLEVSNIFNFKLSVYLIKSVTIHNIVSKKTKEILEEFFAE